MGFICTVLSLWLLLSDSITVNSVLNQHYSRRILVSIKVDCIKY